MPKLPNKKTIATGATAISILGAGAYGIVMQYLPKLEGTVHKGYLDPVKIPTKCTGDTNNVIVGKVYTKEECKQSLEDVIARHAAPILECTPSLKGTTYQLGAAVLFGTNIGVGAYCKSVTAKRFNAGDWKGACNAIAYNDAGKMQWITAKGVVLPGLVERRKFEKALCEKGL